MAARSRRPNTEAVPAPGVVIAHPSVDVPLMHELLRPNTPLWTPAELSELTSEVSTQLLGALIDILEIHDDRRWGVRLGLAQGVEVWLRSWTPGQGTQPHAHDGAGGAFTVIFGELREEYREDGQLSTVDHGADTSTGFTGCRVHQLRNACTVNSASVHASSPPLLPARRYNDLSGTPTVPPQRKVEALER